MSFKEYKKIGIQKKYIFKDSIFNKISKDKGFKHFANFKIVNK